ncbi:aldose 1-epimerase family protein [uncultured Enterococcus sp.]|uniref:aldose 1-epimerase family protein n=1 Tax=uncultured Enterococcus sp. TaxID=167972 RepID=UPI0025D1E700|nr:aldose 1-epimerase family protein [uncultured Enterococcus sp.]
MKVMLENAQYQVTIATLGAEIQQFVDKLNAIEYMWQADPKHWNRHAPVLFPIVGTLKNNQYQVAQKTYTLPRHGFARDQEFELVEQTNSTARFRLVDTNETRAVYPFGFCLEILYTLTDNALEVRYQVRNPDEAPLYFSIGGHPAFNVPLEPGLSFEDYYLVSEPLKSRTFLPLKHDLIDLEHKTLGQTNTAIDLTHGLFKEDALIFETKGKTAFSICSDRSKHGVTLSYKDFPYFGVWSTAPVASNFVCLEPWAGIADVVDATGEFTQKLGIERLDAHEVFDAAYTITVF